MSSMVCSNEKELKKCPSERQLCSYKSILKNKTTIKRKEKNGHFFLLFGELSIILDGKVEKKLIKLSF